MSRGMPISVTSDWSALMLASMIESLLTPLLFGPPGLAAVQAQQQDGEPIAQQILVEGRRGAGRAKLGDGVGEASPT